MSQNKRPLSPFMLGSGYKLQIKSVMSFLHRISGIALAGCYHFCNGIRHLFWDAGKGVDIESAKKSAKMVQVVAPALAVLIIIVGFAI